MKGKIFKRVTSLLSAAAMLLTYADFSAIDFSVHAENGDEAPELVSYDVNGNGKIDDGEEKWGYELDSADDLYWFAAEVNSGNKTINAYLAEDITVNENLLTDLITVDEDGTATVKDQKTVREWTPIGTYDYVNIPYSGTFDGNNKTISGLYFNESDADCVGLFGFVDTVGKIQDVTLADSYFCGIYDVGGVCGANYGTIEYITVTDSYIHGSDSVGGVCGSNTGTISNCYNTGDVSGTGRYVGGVCGYNSSGSIENCYNTGTVNGKYYVGGVCGVCGYNSSGSSSGSIENCYNTGDVSGNMCVGGVCGANDGTIQNCYNIGTVTGDEYVGGACGDNCGTISNCYYLADTDDGNGGKTAQQFASGEVCWLLNGGETQYATHAFFQNLSEKFGGVDALPVLDSTHHVVKHSETSYYNEHLYENGFCKVCGVGYEPATDSDGDGCYEISNVGQLYWFAGLVNGTLGDVEQNKSANAVLADDITVNSGVLNANGELNEAEKENFREWTLIVYYSGTFDGAGHTISGIYYNDSNEWGVGLFKANCGTIRNVGLIDSYICGQNHVGGICGYVQDNGSVSNCYNAGNVTAIESYVGGICGASYVGTSDNIFTNCYNAGKVSGRDSVGGICGYKKNGANVNCYNVGKVSGKDSVGGICGNKQYGAIKNCYYLDTTAPASDYGTAKSETEFASGEVCWLLNSEQSDNPAFYQNIGKDAFPVLDSTHHSVKHNETSYYNEHSYENGICTVCDGYEPAELVDDTEDIDGDDDTTDKVYEISNAGQLYWFADKVDNDNDNFGDANAVLTKNITVNSGVLDEDGKLNEGDFRAWTPIGTYTSNYDKSPYSGTFDGNNKTISGLYFNNDSKIHVGLFGFVGTVGKIQDVTVTDSYFCGSYYVGGICGYNDSGSISNCYNTGDVTATGEKAYVGGVCGANAGGEITNCYNTGDVTATGEKAYVGGICGYIYQCEISNCYNTGDVSGTGRYVGGVCGANDGTIQNCYNTGTVTGDEYVGGACGDNRGTISNCYNTGDVSGNSKVGGVCGDNKSTITNCYFLADTDDGNGGKTASQFASGEVCWLLNVGDTQAETPVFYQNIGTDESPVLDSTHHAVKHNETSYYNEHSYENGFCTVCGYEPATDSDGDGYYEISNAGQLYWFADKVHNDNDNFGDANAVLTKNITVNENLLTDLITVNDDGTATVKSEEEPTAWTPIGDSSFQYSGIFNGNNKTISGLYFNKSDADYVGLFGYVGTGGKIQDVTIADSYFCGRTCVGGVCGDNCGTIKKCYNTGDVEGTKRIGGICGMNTNTLENCYNKGAVKGNDSGGICGTNKSTISNCYYLADSDDGNGGKTENQFRSGEVCWLLNGGENQAETPVFYQNIGKDISPVFDSTHHAVKHSETSYYNEHSYENGICTVCDGYEPAKAVEDVNDIDDDGKTDEIVYEISNAGQLYWFADKVHNDNEHYGSANAFLAEDITVNENLLTDFINVSDEDGTAKLINEENKPRVWTPIGTYTGYYVKSPYSGTFDGNNKTISGLYFNKSDADYVGLFGYVYTGGKIQDVTIADSYMYGETFVGGICGANNGTIENAAVADSYMYGNSVGGVCGANNGTITDCSNTGDVSGSNSVGGICGESHGTITNCYNTGNITGTDDYVGGVCGENHKGEISNCYNTGDVTGTGDSVGGVCGNNYIGEISNCYYLNTVAENGVGIGIPASAEAKDDKQFASGEVCWLLNSGDTQAETPVFYQNIGTDISPVFDSTHHAVKHSETSYYNEHSYENGICTVCDGYEPAKAVEDVNDIDDDGKTDEIVYEISNAGQLYWFADKVHNDNEHYGSANAFLAEDITVNENLLTDLITVDEDGTATLKSEEEPTAWTPIGTYTNDYVNSPYSGTFDGNNKTISGLYFNNDSQRFVGLFGYVGTVGKIQDVTIADSYMYGETIVGGVCGSNNGTIENAAVADSYMYGNTVGGVCGDNGGTITNCSNTGDVSGSNTVGGVCGGNGGTITDCSNTGDVSGSDSVGGVCGENYQSEISNCYNTSDVTGTGNFVGGICGDNFQSEISNCYNTGDVTGDDIVGGVCGYNTGGSISNCYYLADTDDGNGGKTAQQFASGEVCWLLNGGDTQDETPVFYQNIGKDISPVLDKHHTVIKNGESYKNNAHSYENGFCTICGAFEDGMGARLAGHSLTLDGSIGVNFYMELDKSVAEDENAYMHFTLPNGKTEDVNVSQAEKKNVNGMECYVFKCNVAATEMTDTIKAQIKTSSGNGTEYSYTVKEYADYLLAHTADNKAYEDAEELVRAMLNYGAYAQKFKEYNTDSLPCVPSDVSEYVINEHGYTAYAGAKVEFAGANLSMLSNITLRLFFKADDITDVKFMNGAKELEIGKNNGLYFVEIANITPDELSNDFTVSISDGGLVTYSPMTYCYQVSQTSNDAALVNLVKAIAQYNDAAKAYFKEAKV